MQGGFAMQFSQLEKISQSEAQISRILNICFMIDMKPLIRDLVERTVSPCSWKII